MKHNRLTLYNLTYICGCIKKVQLLDVFTSMDIINKYSYSNSCDNPINPYTVEKIYDATPRAYPKK